MARTKQITGATGGIGLASARAFSALGDNVALCDINQDAATFAAQDFAGPAPVLAVDVRSLDS